MPSGFWPIRPPQAEAFESLVMEPSKVIYLSMEQVRLKLEKKLWLLSEGCENVISRKSWRKDF